MTRQRVLQRDVVLALEPRHEGQLAERAVELLEGQRFRLFEDALQ